MNMPLFQLYNPDAMNWIAVSAFGFSVNPAETYA